MIDSWTFNASSTPILCVYTNKNKKKNNIEKHTRNEREKKSQKYETRVSWLGDVEKMSDRHATDWLARGIYTNKSWKENVKRRELRAQKTTTKKKNNTRVVWIGGYRSYTIGILDNRSLRSLSLPLLFRVLCAVVFLSLSLVIRNFNWIILFSCWLEKCKPIYVHTATYNI